MHLLACRSNILGSRPDVLRRPAAGVEAHRGPSCCSASLGSKRSNPDEGLRWSFLPGASMKSGVAHRSDHLRPDLKQGLRFGRMGDLSCRAASTEELSPAAPSTSGRPVRAATVRRQTKETKVDVSINLDGTGVCTSSSQIPFLDHMMDQLASHGLFNVVVEAEGDIHIDDHHTNEDIALALGTALAQALGDRKGIYRFGDFTAPLDEALVHVVLDLSGRPHLSCDLSFTSERIGSYDVQLVEHFFQSLVNTSGMTLHIRQLAGRNSHHIVEATFKAFARALRQATEPDPRREGQIASSKGVLTRN